LKNEEFGSLPILRLFPEVHRCQYIREDPSREWVLKFSTKRRTLIGKEHQVVPKLIVEFIGTFFLVFTVGQTVQVPDGAGSLAALAIGSALMVGTHHGA